MAGRKIHVYDFDGTCTVPTQAGEAAFIRAHCRDLAEHLGCDGEWMVQQYARVRCLMVANPHEYGWEIDGRIVAPALVDAFVEARVCAQVILRELGQKVSDHRIFLDDLYQQHYLLHESTFREELVRVCTAHRDAEEYFYIVTNSDPVKVARRFQQLGGQAAWIRAQIRGHARKFVVTPEAPREVREETSFPDLLRPIFLRKGHYWEVLRTILDEHGADWSDLVVTGDIAELDLALPVELGAEGRLIVGSSTPAYEVAWAEAHPRVRIITSLEAMNP